MCIRDSPNSRLPIIHLDLLILPSNQSPSFGAGTSCLERGPRQGWRQRRSANPVNPRGAPK
eukprot:6656561-Pyramimonas_sp.AAC.1